MDKEPKRYIAKKGSIDEWANACRKAGTWNLILKRMCITCGYEEIQKDHNYCPNCGKTLK